MPLFYAGVLMSFYEGLSLVVACIAVIMSLVAWTGQRKLQREANDMQRATSKLAEKQLEMLLREEEGRGKARLSADLFKDGKTHRLRIRNYSAVVARNINVEILVDDPRDDPLIDSEKLSKLPWPSLAPEAEFAMIAALTLSRPTAFNVLLRWTNPDGAAVEEQVFVAL
ncbi:hypothetical protein [Variovorax saccharolyticus]|uniref:hypothetical protein n=1 Tax=Variovorax saccharolyticus TaxID=3053516 RepID=UPI00257830C4|nr:hypothetical protein [Variovorax sp. J31P216]MDM0025913.1 hypothetical protein [Variovorax sp. J31P216]